MRALSPQRLIGEDADDRRPVGALTGAHGAGDDEPVSHAIWTHRLVALVPGVRTTRAFFFDVDHFAIRRDFPVAARHAAARHGGKSEQLDETHSLTLVTICECNPCA
jgi:hypothetical protein